MLIIDFNVGWTSFVALRSFTCPERVSRAELTATQDAACDLVPWRRTVPPHDDCPLTASRPRRFPRKSGRSCSSMSPPPARHRPTRVPPAVLSTLEGGIADQCVLPAQSLRRSIDECLAKSLVTQIARDQHRLAAGLANIASHFLRVELLGGQIVDRDVGTLARKGDRHRATNAAVAGHGCDCIWKGGLGYLSCGLASGVASPSLETDFPNAGPATAAAMVEARPATAMPRKTSRRELGPSVICTSPSCLLSNWAGRSSCDGGAPATRATSAIRASRAEPADRAPGRSRRFQR